MTVEQAQYGVKWLKCATCGLVAADVVMVLDKPVCQDVYRCARVLAGLPLGGEVLPYSAPVFTEPGASAFEPFDLAPGETTSARYIRPVLTPGVPFTANIVAPDHFKKSTPVSKKRIARKAAR